MKFYPVILTLIGRLVITDAQADNANANPPVWRQIFQTTDRQGNTVDETQEVTIVPRIHPPDFSGAEKSPLDGILVWDGSNRETKVPADRKSVV